MIKEVYQIKTVYKITDTYTGKLRTKKYNSELFNTLEDALLNLNKFPNTMEFVCGHGVSDSGELDSYKIIKSVTETSVIKEWERKK